MHQNSNSPRRISSLKILVIALICFCLPCGLPGEENGANAAAPAKEKPVILRVEAWPGAPFGVAKVSFRLGQQGKLIQNTGAVLITERDNRIFYPAFSEGLLTNVFKRPAVGGVQSVWFLFRGDTPLTLTLRGADTETFVAEMPRRNRPALSRLLFQAWWRQFNAQTKRHVDQADYPPLVETYLKSMLSRRLGLAAPLLVQPGQREGDELKQTFNLLFDVESLRAESIEDLMTQPPKSNLATLPLPEHSWLNTSEIISRAGVTEPIVQFVPEECFYLRFGNWDNQLWLKRLMEEYGGDLSRMISLRGHRSGDSSKMLDQLALETSQVDDWFGGNLIEDVAAIGTDLYVEDGPSNAILMLAKNESLESRVTTRRKKFAKDRAKEGVTLTEVEIAGRTVTLLSTPDNRIRSFYAVENLCHITSSSRTIVERFFRASEGDRSLANNPEFQQARTTMPLEREDTVFIYLSRPFFENLLNPTYQIELSRRNRSLANIQLLQLAQWAARNEGFADDDIDQMIAHGFLPTNFNQLPDGSSCNWIEEAGQDANGNPTTGQWHDTLRGRRGYFTPIADVEIPSITAAESAWLGQRINFYRQELKEVDPLLIAFKRFEISKEVERVVIDGRLAPFGKEKYGSLGKALGPPLQFEVDMGPDALISFQASIAGNMFSRTHEPHQVFASVQGDVPPKTDLQPTSFLELLDLFKTTPGYIGAWPTAGYLDMLPALGGQPDVEGYTYSRILDVWRLQQDQFSLVSFDRARLEAARAHLKVVAAEHPAQVRLRVGDISNSNLRNWANILFFERSWETSIANVRLLNLAIQQFNLPMESALPQVEQLLGVGLVCPLGGEYEIGTTAQGQSVWQSSKWPSFDSPSMPADYEAPPMTWFRGMSLDVYQRNTQFVVHGHLDIARDPSSFGSGGGKIFGNLPSINLFKGFSKVEEIPPGETSDDPDKLPAPNDELVAPKKTDDKQDRFR